MGGGFQRERVERGFMGESSIRGAVKTRTPRGGNLVTWMALLWASHALETLVGVSARLGKSRVATCREVVGLETCLATITELDAGQSYSHVPVAWRG